MYVYIYIYIYTIIIIIIMITIIMKITITIRGVPSTLDTPGFRRDLRLAGPGLWKVKLPTNIVDYGGFH